MAEEIYAEDVNYWQTSTSSYDTWIDRAKREIEQIGGKVTAEAFGNMAGRSAFMLSFALSRDQFKITWPVLKSKTGKEKAAKIQAATMLYHDVKAKCVSAKVLGVRAAFMTYLVLPDGRSASEAASSELVNLLPPMFSLPSGK
jgi:hypothetical protein